MIVGFNGIFVITNEREYLSFKVLLNVVAKQFDITLVGFALVRACLHD